jgi:hypothetical protein
VSTPEELKTIVDSAMDLFIKVPTRINRVTLVNAVDAWTQAAMPKPEWVWNNKVGILLHDGKEFAKITNPRKYFRLSFNGSDSYEAYEYCDHAVIDAEDVWRLKVISEGSDKP